MEKGNYISTILRTKQTVFSARDIMLLWQDTNINAAKGRISYYVKRSKLYRIRRGLYAKDKNYDKLEVATKIFTPSYISFETVLTKAGLVFQYYDRIFVASYVSREIVAGSQTYTYKRIKDALLTNPAGVMQTDTYAIASPERAFLDLLYLSSDYHFDNLSGLNWNKVYEILPIYGGNKRMERKVTEYQKFTK